MICWDWSKKARYINCNVYCRGVARVWSASVQYASAHLLCFGYNHLGRLTMLTLCLRE